MSTFAIKSGRFLEIHTALVSNRLAFTFSAV